MPESPGRRARLAHRIPLEENAGMRRAPLRQKAAVLARSIPDGLVDELIGVLRTSRDRALVSLYLSSGARASELLGVRGDQVDWARQRFPVPVDRLTLAARLADGVHVFVDADVHLVSGAPTWAPA
ncbi:hypothetical protein [Arthrobacter sp. ISL-5]|uniref:hypothetical protein n=1 Tax=Arthrobacter sp. ISL-5 TaxID=2819111 RepID=UPI001BE78BE9|nr:hypothetical protein [Arthrobacter sp. ISL-5]MBT2552712.1 hypothetical protein [Arthrobacter sp. ISL-5]